MVAAQLHENELEHKVSIQDIIEMLGLGVGQVITISVTIGGFFLEGLSLVVLNLLTPTIMHDLKFTESWSIGNLCCSLFAGAVMGEVCCIFLASKVGLSSFIVSGYGILTLCLMLLSFADHEGWFSACRFMIGLGFGLCESTAMALTNELVPERWRPGMIAMSFLCMAVGALLGLAIVLSGPNAMLLFVTHGMNGFDQEWRTHIRLCAIPSVLLFLFSLFYVPDSPHMMARTGDAALARDVLKRIRRFNEMPFVTCAFNVLPGRQELMQAQSIVMSNAMFSLCVVSATMSYLMMGMYSIVIPQVADITKYAHSAFAPGTVLVIGNVAAAFIILLGTTCFALSNTKLGIMVATVVCSFSCAVVYLERNFHWAAESAGALALISVVSSLLATSTLVRVFVYKAALDMQPLSCCVTGLAMVHAAGRLADVFFISIYDFGQTVEYAFFGPLSVICLFCVLLLQTAQIDTWDMSGRAAQLDSDIAAQQRLLVVANIKNQYTATTEDANVRNQYTATTEEQFLKIM